MELLGVARSTEFDKKRPKCVDCAHYKFYEADPVLIFGRPKHRCTAAIDLVTGKTIETDCYAMRHIQCECGPDARLFENASGNGGKPAAAAPSTTEGGQGKALNALLALIVLALLALAFWWAYEYDTSQQGVIQTGEVSQMGEVSVKDGSSRITARTRLLDTGGRSIWQFEASPGVWKDCGDDCEKALRRALSR